MQGLLPKSRLLPVRPHHRELRRRLIAALSVVIAVLAFGGCDGDRWAQTRFELLDANRRQAYDRCLAHSGLENYRAQCELIGGVISVERRTYVCHDAEGQRNPDGMGDGPYCVCPQRDEHGHCDGLADCKAGIADKCAPLLEAEVVPFPDSDDR